VLVGEVLGSEVDGDTLGSAVGEVEDGTEGKLEGWELGEEVVLGVGSSVSILVNSSPVFGIDMVKLNESSGIDMDRDKGFGLGVGSSVSIQVKSSPVFGIDMLKLKEISGIDMDRDKGIGLGVGSSVSIQVKSSPVFGIDIMVLNESSGIDIDRDKRIGL
jgi:hypothetical protein